MAKKPKGFEAFDALARKLVRVPPSELEQPMEHEKEYREGWNARLAQTCREDAPYGEKPLRRAWQRGWDDADAIATPPSPRKRK